MVWLCHDVREAATAARKMRFAQLGNFVPSPNGSAQPAGGRMGRRGFSLLDLLITVGITAVLSSLVLTGLSRTRSTAQSTRCLANLHSIAVAFSQYTLDNNGHYPDPVAAGRSWESLLDSYISQSMIFACPADDEIFPAVGSSYDWRDTPDPQTTLVGKPLAAVTRSDAVLAFETLPGWHCRHRMNAVLVDGSAAVMTDDACLSDLQMPLNSYYRP